MTNKTQSILIFLLMIISIGLIVVWFYVLNYGKAIITTGLENYIIYTGNESIECLNDPCEIKLDVGNYQIQFEKEGYNKAFTSTTISRNKISNIVFSPKKIMKIEPVSIVPKTDKPMPPIPAELNMDDIIFYAWDQDGNKLLFLDKSDDRLKIFTSDKKTNPVTTLKNILSPVNIHWSPNEKYIIINKGKDIYFIETEMGARKKQVLDFQPTQILWSPESNFFLMNDSSDSLYKIEWQNFENINKINIILSLNKSVWMDENTLITYEIDTKQNLTKIWTYDPLASIQESITQKFDFPLDQINYDPIQDAVYFHHSREGGWYIMAM